MDTFAAGGKTVTVFQGDEPGAPIIYLNTFAEGGQKVFEALQTLGAPPVSYTHLDVYKRQATG